ncbi:hypothetical protein ACOSQ3_019914 [Xanthoceras sorbifolium]
MFQFISDALCCGAEVIRSAVTKVVQSTAKVIRSVVTKVANFFTTKSPSATKLVLRLCSVVARVTNFRRTLLRYAARGIRTVATTVANFFMTFLRYVANVVRSATLIVCNATAKTAKVYGGALLVYSAAKILYFLIDEVKIQYVLDILAKFVKCLEKVTKAKRILQSFGVKDLFNPSSTIGSEDFEYPSSSIVRGGAAVVAKVDKFFNTSLQYVAKFFRPLTMTTTTTIEESTFVRGIGGSCGVVLAAI